MKKSNLFAVALTVYVISFLFSCQNIKSTNEMKSESEITSIEYRFGDSSVPPPYHRSYSIIVSAESLRYVVDSYGEIIKDTTVVISKEKWESSKSLFKSCKILKSENKKESEGCTGGTTQMIKLTSGDKVIFEAGNYYCGGQVFGDLKGDVDSFLKKLKDGIGANVFL